MSCKPDLESGTLDLAKENPIDSKFPTWLKVSLAFVCLMAFFLLGLYFSKFNGPLGTQEAFAQFGDFIGGTLNPILGFATVGLLIWSIRLQMKELRLTREELSATRDEAELSRKALENQVQNFDKEAKLTKLSEMINTLDVKYDRLISKPVYDNGKAVSCLHSMGQQFRAKITCEDFIERCFCGIAMTDNAVIEFVDLLNSPLSAKVVKYQWTELEQTLLKSYMVIMRYDQLVDDKHLTGIYLESLAIKMMKLNVYAQSQKVEASMEAIQQFFDEQSKD